GAGCKSGEKGPRIQKVRVVGVILNRDHFHTAFIRQAGSLQGGIKVGGGWVYIDAKNRGLSKRHSVECQEAG
ncbi:MAG: hypothetical protein CVU40_08630, partial [Chloroflexi bacterium HGW-Chloroflexi-2]